MKKNSPLNIIIDTNLWVSFIISRHFYQLDEIIFSRKARLLFSAELVEELKAVIEKPKLKKYFKEENALELMLLAFDEYIDFVDVESKISVCRDPNDDFLLALARDGKAHYLLTGDKDLLSIKQFEHTQIVTVEDFIKNHLS